MLPKLHCYILHPYTHTRIYHDEHNFLRLDLVDASQDLFFCWKSRSFSEYKRALPWYDNTPYSSSAPGAERKKNFFYNWNTVCVHIPMYFLRLVQRCYSTTKKSTNQSYIERWRTWCLLWDVIHCFFGSSNQIILLAIRL